jgi:hypothetical protein
MKWKTKYANPALIFSCISGISWLSSILPIHDIQDAIINWVPNWVKMDPSGNRNNKGKYNASE